MVNTVVVALRRAVGFAAMWWIVTEGAPTYWGYGVATVLGCLLLSLRVLPPAAPPAGSAPARIAATTRLIVWYLWHTAIGAIDVAARALRRPVDVDPAIIAVPVTLPDGPARHLALGMFNLMPGTLVQGIDGDTAYVHALDAAMPVARQWTALEERVAAATGRV